MLHDYLFKSGDSKGYNPNLRPVRHSSDKVHVSVRLGIKRIFEMDELNHRVTLFAVLIKRWKDEFLKWNPDDYGGITHIYTDYTKVWNPQLSLISKYIDKKSAPADNSVHKIYENFPIKIFSDGNIEFVPSLNLENECIFNYARFPFEYQICKFKFQMPYDLNQIKLSMSSYYTNELNKFESVWSIEDLDEVVTSDQYPTCEILIRFKRVMKNNLFTMPSYIVYILTLLMFLLPQQSSQRIIIGSVSLVITTLMSYMLTNSISHNEVNTMPLLGKLYLFNSVLLVVSLAFSAFIIKISSSDHTKAVPDWLKKVTINVLSKIFCVQAIAYTVFNSYNFKAHDDESIAVQEQISNNLVLSNNADNVRVRFNNSQSPGPSGQSANIETTNTM